MSKGQKLHTPSSVWALVDRAGAGCWEWRGMCSARGYGDVSLNGKMYRAHRVIAFLSGMIDSLKFDPAKCVLHKCDNRLCCNPSHFFIGSHADNNRDMTRKGRHVPVIGNKNGQSKLSDAEFTNALRLISGGATIAHVARIYGVARGSIGERVRRHEKRISNDAQG